MSHDATHDSAQMPLALDARRDGAPLRVAGVDEAGRGPLAGPVVVAAVVFAPGRTPINGLDDSKQLTAQRREALYERIVQLFKDKSVWEAIDAVAKIARKNTDPSKIESDLSVYADMLWNPRLLEYGVLMAEKK